MIERVSIQSFAVAEDVAVDLHPGLNVFTGETGAGKSIIVGALDFALGARRGREVIATGAERASVSVQAQKSDGMAVSIERSVSGAGRTSARIDGETARIDELRALAGPWRHSRAVGAAFAPATYRPADAPRRVRGCRRGSEGTRGDRPGDSRGPARARRHNGRRSLRERLIDQLRYEVDEIDGATSSWARTSHCAATSSGWQRRPAHRGHRARASGFRSTGDR